MNELPVSSSQFPVSRNRVFSFLFPVFGSKAQTPNRVLQTENRKQGSKPQTANRKQVSAGFTLIEMIMVIVITGIIGGIVAVFLKAPIQQYMDVSRRAELTDIADTALYHLAGDISTAVPNSARVPNPSCVATGTTPCYVEFLPTKDGGRYRSSAVAGGPCVGAGDLAFSPTVDTCFEIIGSAITFNSINDQIVVGSTQSDGAPPYQLPTSATGIRRAIDATGVGTFQYVKMTSTTALPAWAELPSQRFDVVDGTQQAVTYACVGTFGELDAKGNGQAKLMRYWNYGFNPAQVLPTVGGAILADKVSGCVIDYAVANQRMGLLGVRLTLTSGGEIVSLYQEIHVSNAP